MNPVLSSPNAIGKLFIHGTLTKQCEHEDVPSCVSIKILQSELVSNAVSVRSTLGDGLTGHLFLVINDDEYTKVTPGTVNPTPPLKPTLPAKPTISTMTTRSTSDLDSLITYDFYWMEYQAYQ